VSATAAAHLAGHAPELADAPATGAPAESVPAEEQTLSAPAAVNGAPAEPASTDGAPAPVNGAPAEPAPTDGAPAEPAPAPAPAALAAEAADLFGRPFGELGVGDGFTTAARVVQEADILQFADLTGDAHPQHVDANWAAGSRFGEQIAHGLLVLSFAVGLLPLDPERVVALRRLGDAVFKQPVKIGDTLHVEGETSRTQELDPEHGLVEARIRIVNQHGRLAVRANVELVWRS
jgi:3-hydroxybutyryl-CoA dehydratase